MRFIITERAFSEALPDSKKRATAARRIGVLFWQRAATAAASFLSAERRTRASRLVIVAACRELEANHCCKSETARKVLELIFQGMVAQKTVTLLVRLSTHMRSSALSVGFLSHSTVPSSVSSTSTKPWLRAAS